MSFELCSFFAFILMSYYANYLVLSTFYPVALKPLGIVPKAFVTFPECMWAKSAENFFQISPLVFPIWRLKNDIRLKKFENPILRCYLVSEAHKNKISTAVPMFLGMTFSMAIIFTSPGDTW